MARVPPQTFICPITQQIMVDPVIDGEGNSYDREVWRSHSKVPRSRRAPNLRARTLPTEVTYR
jgi:hypothetical protein